MLDNRVRKAAPTGAVAFWTTQVGNPLLYSVCHITRPVISFELMIRSFRDPDTEALFRDQVVPRFRAIERVARRKLLYLHQARRLDDLKVPPGNRLEPLKGDRKGQHSIRVNDQWRICFAWRKGEIFDVEIVDYH